jgi:hypothetical protein
MFSPDSGRESPVDEVCLPKIGIRSKQADLKHQTVTSRGVMSDDVNVSADTTRVMPCTDVPYSPLYGNAVGERFSQGTTAIARRPLGDLGINDEAAYSPLYSDVAGERLSQGTSVIPRRPMGDLGINNETMRVLPVDPKLTIDTGECVSLLLYTIAKWTKFFGEKIQ